MFKITFKYFFTPAIALGLSMSVMQGVFGVKVVPEGVMNDLQMFMQTGNMPQSHKQTTIGGDFELMNQHGKLVNNVDFKGKLMLVYFGFTHCPDVCPTDLGNISTAMEMLADKDKERIVPLFVTVDPARDTVERMADYMQHFYGGLQALTGSKDQVDVATKAYRVFAKKVEMEGMGDYMMEHSAYIYLMGYNGEYLRHFRHSDSPQVLLDGIKAAL